MTSSPKPVLPPRTTSSSASRSFAEICTYLSRLELGQIAREGAEAAPTEERFEGTVLFVDVSGFTPITESLAKQGPRGAEILSEILSDYYGSLTGLVERSGGDVLFFAGDAAVALFRAAGDAHDDAARSAVACGLEIRRTLDRFTIRAAPGLELSLRAMVGTGALSALRLGVGPRLTLVTGAPFRQIARMSGLTPERGVVVSPEAHSLVAREATYVDWMVRSR